MNIYLQQDGSQTGPFDEPTVREHLNKGILSADVYAWREGMSDWRPLGEILAATTTPFHVALPASSPAQATLFPAALVAAKSTKMPWWGKLLLGCGGTVALGIILLAVVIAYALYQDQRGHRGSSGAASANWDKADKAVAQEPEQRDQTWEKFQAEMERDMADTEHYTTTKTNNPDGGTTTTITPKGNVAGSHPITKRVDLDGRTTTTWVDAEGNTVFRTEDKNGNVSTITSGPKQGQATP